MQGGEKDCSRAHQGTRVGAASSRDRGGGRGGKGGKDGTSSRSTPQQPGPRGVAPLRPAHSPGPSRQGLARPDSAPTHSPTSGALPCATRRPSRVRWRRSGRWAHTPSKLLASSLPRLPPLRLQLPGREGPCPSRPLPPGYIRSRRSRPPARA